MSSYTAPLTDFRFALHDVLGAHALFARLGYTEASTDIIDAVLEEAGRFTSQVLAPLNSVGDEIGCAFDKSTHAVTTPPGFRAAYDQFVEGGWNGLTAEPQFGGQGMPHTLGVPLSEMISAANLA
ncbi:acyl-CoA dehydrogenase N-terminal domain-containing protein, partial [Xanthomonas perforans]|uniref:acyl-CoA dehydrogenase N-terminal domain-containing protein n=1 Tax=Xanthomonas perforans TaxID=442694 RepID=UPI001F2E412C